MGKSEGFLTPKAISKRIKAKGLQRLRWYCQLCQKQCRDENGFKCHTESESHQRMMLLFADAPGRFVGQYSTEFRNAFLDVLKHRFGTKRVHANVVYQEYIKDRDHVHMNSTRWSTLTGFVAYLGREGFCEVEETEQGLFIRYIDKQAAERFQRAREIEKDRLREEQRQEQIIRKQREEALKREAHNLERNKPIPENLYYRPSDKKISLCLKPAQARLADENIEEKVSPLTHSPAENKFQEDTKEQGVTYKQLNWLEENLVVRVKNTELENGYYFKRKGVIKEVFDLYIADVEILQLGDLIRLDQEDLEPVIPQPGGQVRVIYGENKGTNATILSLDMERKTACLKPETQSESSLMLNDVPLQYICKRAQ
ncbi:zinc finger protein [Galdieria sulphuraria]|uniref:Zinc finger protein n=1 Tax=Galdieria sulphuraria TaxID=130081 RepID=M2WU82_GALSU|nr:zinc finger protein [Galdieria sulphuraria]EME27470.1 zinc finger protein [Galdieria sulphuraria]|eukprot:XP_005703990.1 zinc finger protein [Galdieria sulphuraria]